MLLYILFSNFIFSAQLLKGKHFFKSCECLGLFVWTYQASTRIFEPTGQLHTKMGRKYGSCRATRDRDSEVYLARAHSWIWAYPLSDRDTTQVSSPWKHKWRWNEAALALLIPKQHNSSVTPAIPTSAPTSCPNPVQSQWQKGTLQKTKRIASNFFIHNGIQAQFIPKSKSK